MIDIFNLYDVLRPRAYDVIPFQEVTASLLGDYGSCCWNTDSALEAEGTGLC